MKKHIAFALFFLPLFCFGQTTSGEVFYDEIIQMPVPDGLPEEMKKDFPTSQIIAKQLVFNEKAAIWQAAPDKPKGDLEIKTGDEDGDGPQFNMVMKVPENTLHTHLETGATTNSQEFFGKFFLVAGEQRKMDWRLVAEQKKIGDWLCQKAVLKDTAQKVTAWYAPKIPVAVGPEKWAGLPGLILELDIDEGARRYMVSELKMRKIEPSEIEKPTKGKPIAQADFEKIRAEKLKEMGAVGGKGGMMKIITTEERH